MNTVMKYLWKCRIMIFYEVKKAISSPILIGLIILFMFYNLFLIFDRSQMKEELKVVNQLAETYGIQITDEVIKKYNESLQTDLRKLNEITRKRTGQEFSSIDNFLDTLRNKDVEHYSDEERDFFKELQLRNMYYHLADNIDSRYEKMDWEKVGEAKINMYQLSDRAAELVRNEYHQLSNRFEEMKEKAEHKTWFFAGNPYRMHSFLFRTLFGHIIFEALIMIALATAFITNFEFENQTHLVTYTTKRGRSLIKDKLAASLIIGTVTIAFLMLTTLGTFFAVFDYSYLLGSSISSALNWEYERPYVSWWEMSFLSYLIWSILLIYVCILLFTAVSFIISILVKNNYFSFFLFAAFFAISYLLQGFMPKSSLLIFIAGYNLSQLVMNPHIFFMGNGFNMFRYYELVTIFTWTTIIFLVSWVTLKKFQKQDIQ